MLLPPELSRITAHNGQSLRVNRSTNNRMELLQDDWTHEMWAIIDGLFAQHRVEHPYSEYKAAKGTIEVVAGVLCDGITRFTLVAHYGTRNSEPFRLRGTGDQPLRTTPAS